MKTTILAAALAAACTPAMATSIYDQWSEAILDGVITLEPFDNPNYPELDMYFVEHGGEVCGPLDLVLDGAVSSGLEPAGPPFMGVDPNTGEPVFVVVFVDPTDENYGEVWIGEANSDVICLDVLSQSSTF